MIELANVDARAAVERGRGRPVLTDVTLKAGRGVFAVIGAHKDGTALLLDVIDGTTAARAGKAVVLGDPPARSRHRVARVSMDAPLPDALRVDEVCDLAADLRGEARRPAGERLAVLGAEALARRRARALTLEERRTVSLAIALSSANAEVLLVEEPLLALEPVAPSRVEEALRARAESACVIVTTASARDAARLADGFGVLTAGSYAAMGGDLLHVAPGLGRSVAVRVIVSPSHGRSGAAALVAALGADDAVSQVQSSAYVASDAAAAGAADAGRTEGVALVVSGRDLERLAGAITRAIAVARVDVELIEPEALPLDAIRQALRARAASPPRGTLPPVPRSVPPAPPAPPEPSAPPAGPSSRPGPA